MRNANLYSLKVMAILGMMTEKREKRPNGVFKTTCEEKRGTKKIKHSKRVKQNKEASRLRLREKKRSARITKMKQRRAANGR